MLTTQTEQESLIRTLQTQNTLRNTQYTTAFLALPLLSILVYLPPLLRPSTAVLSTLSISSLLASAYILWSLPSLPPLPALWASERPEKQRGWSLSGDRMEASTRTGAGAGLGVKDGVEKGPLELYLPSLNAVLVALLAFAGFVGQKANEGQGGGMWFALLPGVVYVVVVVAKGIMGGVDVGELEALRYGYKGA
jgi:hypothetical protein